jgi:hypothetical protein
MMTAKLTYVAIKISKLNSVMPVIFESEVSPFDLLFPNADTKRKVIDQCGLTMEEGDVLKIKYPVRCPSIVCL